MTVGFKRICVYCGSSNRVDDKYLEVARTTGRTLAERGIGVVYGGGNIGLMGALADAALAADGEVHGVIPDKLLDLELGHRGITELHVVPDLHARKALMVDLSDGFVALPGGWGTLEEIFEVTTWAQLEYHDSPVGLLNAHGYYDHLVAFLDHAHAEGFIRPIHRGLLQVAADLPTLLDGFASYGRPTLTGVALSAR